MYTATDLQQAYDEGMAAGRAECEALHPNIITLADNALSVLITGSILAQTQGDGTSMAENICRLRAELAEARAALMAQAPAPAAPPAEHQGAQGG